MKQRDTRIVKKETLPPLYNPSDKEQEARMWAYNAFDVMWNNQTRNYSQFGGASLATYLDDGRKLINLMAKKRKDKRSNIKSVAPLNKLMAILARVALNRPKIKVSAENKFGLIDPIRAAIINDLYQYSFQNIDNEHSSDIDYFMSAFNCESDGICINYEGYDSQTHTRKTITEYNPDTGEAKFEPEEFKIDSCFSLHLAPEDFFIYNPFCSSLQLQPKVAWRTLYDKAHFDSEFKNFKNFKFVRTGGQLDDKLIETYYRQGWKDRIDKEQIEVCRVFDRWEDRMVIVANGVILQDTPLIWNNGKRKKYPFSRTVSAPFAGGDFFWGMSLAWKLQGDTSALDTLYNLGIEQAKLAVNPPYLTTAENDIENEALFAGRQIEVNDVEQFRELKFSSPDASFFNFIQLMGKNIDFASLDPVSTGQAQAGVTARGQIIAEENARKLLSQFNMMMEDLTLQEAKLRVPNIIQFQILPGYEARVNTTVKNEDGVNENGVREIKFVESAEDFESQEYIDMVEKMAKLNNINLERLNFTADYLKNIKYTITIQPETAYQQARSVRQALTLEKASTVAKLFPNIFQSASELFFKDIMEAYDDDANKYLESVKQSGNQQIIQQLQQMAGGSPIAKEMAGQEKLSTETLMQ